MQFSRGISDDIGVEFIAAFHENGYVVRYERPGVNNSHRCELNFRGQAPSAFGYLPICDVDPVGEIDLILGVNPDPSAPTVVRWLEVNGRTPQKPGPNNGFEVLGTAKDNSSQLILKRTAGGKNDFWKAYQTDNGNGNKFWQAVKIGPNPQFDPLPPEPTPADENPMARAKTWFTKLIENLDYNAAIAGGLILASIVGIIIWRKSRKRK